MNDIAARTKAAASRRYKNKDHEPAGCRRYKDVCSGDGPEPFEAQGKLKLRPSVPQQQKTNAEIATCFPEVR
jgi:hypothetical protein